MPGEFSAGPCFCWRWWRRRRLPDGPVTSAYGTVFISGSIVEQWTIASTKVVDYDAVAPESAIMMGGPVSVSVKSWFIYSLYQ
jgi:drug/metabolite transporter superfamily protein YnfA